MSPWSSEHPATAASEIIITRTQEIKVSYLSPSIRDEYIYFQVFITLK